MPSKLFGVDAVVAVHEGVVEQRLDGARLELHDGRFEVLDVRTGGLEEVVDVGVAAEDLQRGGGLGEGRRALRPSRRRRRRSRRWARRSRGCRSSPLPTISTNGRRCRMGLSCAIVSITPESRVSLREFAGFDEGEGHGDLRRVLRTFVLFLPRTPSPWWRSRASAPSGDRPRNRPPWLV